ncbi:MAG: RNA-binding protein [Erysipelotrichaceae bacterium]|nr:RNA-binding protein [Erysipelotrichaceae bacterium]
MLEHFKGDEEFVKKIIDYRDRADRSQSMILTKFLDPHQRMIVQSVVGHTMQLVSYGGMENAEYARMIICPDYYEITHDDFNIVVFKVKYNENFGTLRHKDVLGALMHLGIERECIGDICESPLAFTCTKENSDYILMNLTKIRRSSIELIETNEVITISHDFKTKELVVSSLRLDKIIGALFGLSRTKASEAIRAGLVKVNYKSIEDVNHLCHNSDVISFRRHGRAELIVTDRRTKQGNIVIEGKIYQ